MEKLTLWFRGGEVSVKAFAGEEGSEEEGEEVMEGMKEHAESLLIGVVSRDIRLLFSEQSCTIFF